MSSEPNAFQVGPLSSEEFRFLLRRYRVLVSQLSLASKDFGDLSGLPKGHVAAALVVQEASAELEVVHDRLHEWYLRQSNISQPVLARTPESAAASSPRVSLVLTEYALEKKVSLIRVLREAVPGCSLTTAKTLVEQKLPAPIADGLTPEQAEAVRQRFEAVGAICKVASAGRFAAQ
jgi:ribosomal protein L7/L12